MLPISTYTNTMFTSRVIRAKHTIQQIMIVNPREVAWLKMCKSWRVYHHNSQLILDAIFLLWQLTVDDFTEHYVSLLSKMAHVVSIGSTSIKSSIITKFPLVEEPKY